MSHFLYNYPIIVYHVFRYSLVNPYEFSINFTYKKENNFRVNLKN